jgi:hypothetical protein
MSHPKRSAHRSARSTLLLVGEGKTEKVFLKYLCSLYCNNGEGVAATIKQARGKGPENVIGKTARYAQNNGYDRHVALLDKDIPWSEKIVKFARQKRIDLVESNPCIEGLFLSIMNKSVPDSPQKCKAAIINFFPSLKPLERESYAQYFSKTVLEEARKRIPELDRLLQYLEDEHQ